MTIQRFKRFPVVLLTLVCAFGCSSSEGDDGTVTDGAAQDQGQADMGVSADAQATDGAITPVDTGATDSEIADAQSVDAVVPPAPDMAPAIPDAAPDAQPPMDTFELTSTAFSEGDMIPYRHTCFSDEDVQPKLVWRNPPEGTLGFAVVLIDETFDFVHWVVIHVPTETRSLREGASDTGALPAGSREIPAYGNGPFRGPCTPPPGPHTYAFRVYALDTADLAFPFSGRMNEQNLATAFGRNTLGVARLSGTCRPPQ